MALVSRFAIGSARSGPLPVRVPLLCVVTVLLVGCGKKGPPLPPLKIVPEGIAALRARQIGDRIVLSFNRPGRRTDEQPLGADAVVHVYMTAQQPAPRDPAVVAANPAIAWKVDESEWDAYARGGRLRVGLPLESIAAGLEVPGGARALRGRQLSFVVQVIEPKKRRSRPSPISHIVVCDPPPAPIAAVARVTPKGIRLEFSPGPGQQRKVRFNIYRRAPSEKMPEDPLQASPQEATTYLDARVPVDQPFLYTVRATSASGCESSDGATVLAAYEDLYPPAPPEGLAAVAEEGIIRLFWRPSREPDLRGYRIYRADGAEGAWHLLTPEDLTTTTYSDKTALPGISYAYAVTALDSATSVNESRFSDQAVEVLGGAS
ncbi:MAG: fibronectin type III domain-containing protein [Acidobacteriota bacterium]